MKKTLLTGTMVTMMACSPFLMGTAVYASENIGAVKTTETEKPSLVQDDFFYFVKTMVEDIKMALALNDLEKAKLLSEQAAERIAEAGVLNKKGKDDLTQDTLEKAAEDLEKAETGKLVSKEEKEAAKVKVHIGNNIEALTKVLDQVENPKAKAAITKNIEKSFSKIAAKIEKEQEKEVAAIAKENKKTEKNIEVTPEQPAQPAVSHEKHEQSNKKGQTEKNDHQDNGKKIGHEKQEDKHKEK